ncbi:MAG: YbaB/EbfC family nucleoid-associated protein [Rhodospirillales bacterium]|nr:YbaB/EbfC family nucleoid-associated protein [Rhodospirillales bacterium]
MVNFSQMMKQAQELQAKMAAVQEKLGQIEVTGSSGGGMVKVTLSGKAEARKVKIDPSLMNGAEIEVLEDLLVAAVNDAKSKVEAEVAKEMSDVTGGLKLPPGFLPG